MGALAFGGLSVAAGDDDPSAQVAREQRERFGLSTDQELIVRLASDPDANRDWGLPLTKSEAAELDRRGDINDEAQQLDAYADEHPTKFGQFWVDNPGGGILVVEVTDAATSEDRATARLLVPDGIDIRFEEVTNSRKALIGLFEAYGKELLDDPAELAGIVGIGISLGTNKLEMTVLPERVDRVRVEVQKRGQLDRIKVVEGPADENTTCTSRGNCWDDPIRGGIHMSPDGCTLGFWVHATNSSWERLLTAGHCLQGDLGVMRYYASSSHHLGQGLSEKYYNGSFGDFGLLQVDEHQGMAGHTVYNTTSDNNSPIAGTRDVLNGAIVCELGAASGHRCDDVYLQPYLSNGLEDGIDLMYQKVAHYYADYGDSGASVTSGDKATGIQSRKHDGHNGVFSGIEYLTLDYGYYAICVSGGSSDC